MMIRTLAIMIALIAVFALYKMQHVRPIDDPKDSPIFQQRLQSSLDRFQEYEPPASPERMRDRKSVSRTTPPSPRPPAQTKELVAAGRCGRATLTWVAEQKIEKSLITIKRKTLNEDYSLLKGTQVYEREESGGGIRYWIADSGLTDGVSYEYLITFKDAQGKEVVKKPVSLNLTCTDQDREILAQREKALKEYYQQKEVDRKEYAARSSSEQTPLPARTKELLLSGRCGRVTLTWVEEQKIEKETITITRKTPGEEYSQLKEKRIYDREEAGGGIRYWLSDRGLTDGVQYEYLVSFKDTQGKEISKKPVSISLTCNERDREILAQQEKVIKEYYQKRGVKPQDNVVPSPPSYQLSKETYQIDPGNSPRRGRKDASVTLVVFTDFECLYCSTWADTLYTMVNTFPREVTIIFKNYPLAYHSQSESAAVAALAAGEQGKFWEMHDLLFKNQKALDQENILGYAKALGLDSSQFKKSLENRELKMKVEQDKALGKALGVQSTPTTFINGRRFAGSPPASYIKGLIEDVLKQ
jgi:protein-disulfide isomerase